MLAGDASDLFPCTSTGIKQLLLRAASVIPNILAFAKWYELGSAERREFFSPGLRAKSGKAGVFFMAPQTIINDLKTGICDPMGLVLLVVDEAHRATRGYGGGFE